MGHVLNKPHMKRMMTRLACSYNSVFGRIVLWLQVGMATKHFSTLGTLLYMPPERLRLFGIPSMYLLNV